MNNYVILALGWIVGQTAYGSVSAYIIQKDMPGIDYWQALKIYFKKEIGSFAMALSALLVLMFIFPDFFDPTVSRAQLKTKEALSFVERMIVYLRVSSVIVGGLSQHLLFIAFKKGKKAIQSYAEKNNIDSNT
jgi:hypothetical protein